MTTRIPSDSAFVDPAIAVHQQGCCCSECALYDDKRAAVETGNNGLSVILPVGESAGAQTSGGPADDGASVALIITLPFDGVERAPPTDVVFIDTVPGDTSSTVTLAIGTSVTGTLDTVGDRDWFRVTLTAGQTYTFATSATGAGDITDSFLRLHNSAGTVIAQNDDASFPTNLFSRIVFTATASGDYFVNVAAYNDAAAGNFRLTASVDIADAIAGNATTAARLTVDGPTVNGLLDVVGDHDWYRVDLVAGQSYVLRTNATGGANDPDTFIRLFGTNGTTQLAENDDGDAGNYSTIRFTATSSGTHYLDVGAFGDAQAGSYNVSLSIAPPLPVFTNDQIADQLLNGFWGGAQNARHFNVTAGGTITYNVAALTAAGQTLAREAFNLWSDATGIRFQEIASTANITLDDNQSGAFASSTRSGNVILSSIVNVSTQWLDTYGIGLNTYSFQTYIHEIGHAIGLGHGGPYNGSATYGQDNSYQNDAWATTVMSYFSQNENNYFAAQGFTQQFVVSPIVADVLATNIAYGTATTTRTGATTYGFGNNSGRAIYDATQYAAVSYTIVDHGGNDTLNYSGFTQNQRIDLNAEAFSNVGGRTGNVTIARGTQIENAIGGSGSDALIGNAVGNTLTGGSGDDMIDGAGGDDIIDGGIGNDMLIGGDGSDRLFGGTGADTINAGNGNDRIQVDNAGDVVIGGAGADTLQIITAGLTYIVASDVEIVSNLSGGNLTVTLGSAANTFGGSVGIDTVLAGAGQDSVYGRAGDDMLSGEAANDYLFGEAGSDTLNGGDGNDFLYGGTEGDNLNGGIGNDTIYGQDGADQINGGSGIDISYGGTGADRFIFAAGDSGSTTATADRIGDFSQAQADRIDLSSIDAINGGADNGFAFIGTAAFSNVAGQLRYQQISGVTWVQGDMDGNGIADLMIRIDGLHTLVETDFIL